MERGGATEEKGKREKEKRGKKVNGVKATVARKKGREDPGEGRREKGGGREKGESPHLLLPL